MIDCSGYRLNYITFKLEGDSQEKACSRKQREAARSYSRHHINMDKDKDSIEGEAQDVTIDPGTVGTQARAMNVFHNFSNGD